MDNRFGSRGGSYNRDREMFDVVCSDCQKKTQVPFKPTEGRPVYCRDCLPKHKEQRRF
ncbi:MAG: CxxC-x17-CxxC domain-containing protein [Candidatus Woesearchaeota archaeon]